MIAQLETPTGATPNFELTAAGWVVMLLSVGFVTALLIWCIYRVLRESSPEKVHSQVDIEPPDEAAERQHAK
ncbi:hypothetical protein [Fontivita pretiosa]|uniref:hypothetical protein n=1 Tax=Fontivita pretiosa TaxID=2989684 RepID=UPI003D18496E